MNRRALQFIETGARDEVILVFNHPSSSSTHGMLRIWINPYERVPVNTVFQVGGMVAYATLKKLNDSGSSSDHGGTFVDEDWHGPVFQDPRSRHEGITATMLLIPPRKSTIGRREFTDLCRECALESIERNRFKNWRVLSVYNHKKE